MTEPVSLNLFQRLLRQWEQAHPYNAAQALLVRGSIDPSRATQAWYEAVQSIGLGRVSLAGSRFKYEHINGTWRDRAIHQVPPSCKLADYLSDQLNNAFDDPEEPPFRPFIRQDGDRHHIGLIYQHWVADSISIRLLLREWFLRLHDPAAASVLTIRQPDRGYWRLFGPDNSNWHLTEGAINMFRRYFRYRQVKKIDSTSIEDTSVSVRLDESNGGVIDQVRDYAHANGVKVNDIFVATMADLSRRFVPLQHRAKRTDIAIGSIVDLRPFSHSRLDDVFSIFLGLNSVVCTPRELADWKLLLTTVSKQNRAHRESGMIQSSLLWMMSALAAGRFVRPEKLYHFYRKEVPLAGGVSNVVLNSEWSMKYHPDPIISYLRVSPTGPMIPVVFTTTTLGSHLQVGVTYRNGLIGSDRAAAMTQAFFARLRSLV